MLSGFRATPRTSTHLVPTHNGAYISQKLGENLDKGRAIPTIKWEPLYFWFNLLFYLQQSYRNYCLNNHIKIDITKKPQDRKGNQLILKRLCILTI